MLKSFVIQILNNHLEFPARTHNYKWLFLNVAIHDMNNHHIWYIFKGKNPLPPHITNFELLNMYLLTLPLHQI